MSDTISANTSGDARQKRALFLMHNYNDIDHMTPVIHTLAETGGWQCSVVSYPMATGGSVDFDSDWRFAYVRETYGISVDRIEAVAPGVRLLIGMFNLRETLTRWCDATPGLGRLFGRDLRGLLPWFLAWRFYDNFLSFWMTHSSSVGRGLFKKYGPDVIAIDWGRTHGVISPLLSEAVKRGVPVLQLPHGAWTYEGIYSHASQFDPAKLNKPMRLPVIEPDAMVIDNVYKGLRSVAQGVTRDCLRLLGLPRFTPQWQSVLASLPKGKASQPVDERPRLVWFPTWLMASNLDAVDSTLAVLEEFSDRVDIVLKVHTRNPAHERDDYGRRLLPGSRIQLVANEEESFAMTRWADLVLVTQSSIVYDALLMEKPVIYLKHTHDFDCIWEPFGVCDAVTSPEQLRDRLEALVEGRYQPGYTAEQVEEFLRVCVSGGLEPAEVLPSHVTLFEQAARHEPLSVGADLSGGESAWRNSGYRLVNTTVRTAAKDKERLQTI